MNMQEANHIIVMINMIKRFFYINIKPLNS